jgi:hypothetical protein
MTVNFFPKEPGMMGPVIPALGRLRQNFKFKVSFDSIMGPFLKKKKKRKKTKCQISGFSSHHYKNT